MKPILPITIVSLLMLFGCQQTSTEENQTSTRGLAENSQTQDQEKNGQAIAKHLTDIVSRVPEVDDVTAVVLGDIAIVGIDVNNELDRSDVGMIKYSVAEALQSDPYGARAFVTADVDVVTRLREMRTQMNAGHPVAGIMDELAAIVGRLMPVTPGAEHKKSEPEPTDANDERMPRGQENQLENIQEEQGKRDMEIEDRGNRRKTEDDIPNQGTQREFNEIDRSKD